MDIVFKYMLAWIWIILPYFHIKALNTAPWAVLTGRVCAIQVFIHHRRRHYHLNSPGLLRLKWIRYYNLNFENAAITSRHFNRHIEWCRLDTKEHPSMKDYSKLESFHTRKWKISSILSSLQFANLWNVVLQGAVRQWPGDDSIRLTEWVYGTASIVSDICCCLFYHVHSLVQDCSISIVNALEIVQSCTKPSICCVVTTLPKRWCRSTRGNRETKIVLHVLIRPNDPLNIDMSSYRYRNSNNRKIF